MRISTGRYSPPTVGPATLADEEILEQLVALNHERAEEERAAWSAGSG